jgi:hypothetical protein
MTTRNERPWLASFRSVQSGRSVSESQVGFRYQLRNDRSTRRDLGEVVVRPEPA